MIYSNTNKFSSKAQSAQQAKPPRAKNNARSIAAIEAEKANLRRQIAEANRRFILSQQLLRDQIAAEHLAQKQNRKRELLNKTATGRAVLKEKGL